MNQQQKTTEQAYKALPAHLQKAIDSHNQKLQQFGLLDLSSIDKSKFDDFHPIHAMV
jgi:hypothetical protein